MDTTDACLGAVGGRVLDSEPTTGNIPAASRCETTDWISRETGKVYGGQGHIHSMRAITSDGRQLDGYRDMDCSE